MHSKKYFWILNKKTFFWIYHICIAYLFCLKTRKIPHKEAKVPARTGQKIPNDIYLYQIFCLKISIIFSFSAIKRILSNK